MRVLDYSELDRRQRDLYHELLEASSMHVQASYEDDGDPLLKGLLLSISGPLAILPSIANSHEPAMKRVISKKTGAPVKMPYVKKTPETQAKLSALTSLFIRTAGNRETLTFGKLPVHVQLNLADIPGRCWDSHNYSKAACDLLEFWGVVQNDSRAQAFPIKKSQYDCVDIYTTEIYVVRFSAVKAMCRGFIEGAIGACGFQRSARDGAARGGINS